VGENGTQYGRFSFVLIAIQPPAPKPYETGRTGPSSVNVLGCHMRSLWISWLKPGECQSREL